MTVRDVLAAPAACRELTIRSVAPMALIVLEVEAPARLETTAWSDSEFAALLRWLREDDAAREVVRAYAGGRLDADGFDDLVACRREDEHAGRLSAGHPSATFASLLQPAQRTKRTILTDASRHSWPLGSWRHDTRPGPFP